MQLHYHLVHEPKISLLLEKYYMPVNIQNLPGLSVLDFKETDTEYHVQAEPTVISRLCPTAGGPMRLSGMRSRNCLFGISPLTVRVSPFT